MPLDSASNLGGADAQLCPLHNVVHASLNVIDTPDSNNHPNCLPLNSVSNLAIMLLLRLSLTNVIAVPDNINHSNLQP